MKKYLLITILLNFVLILTGCNITAKQTVESYFDNYNNLTDDVLVDIKNVVNSDDTLNEENKELYEEVLKKQYKNLNYKIENERYDGDEATITVKVSVFDYYKAEQIALDYLKDNPSAFNDNNGNYDNNAFINYKLKEMNLITEKIDYTIDIYLVNTSDGWVINDLSESDLNKIHGIYNYES